MVAMEYSPIKGGGGTFVKNLITGLSNLEVDIHLLTNGDVDSEEMMGKITILRRKQFKELYFGTGGLIGGIDLLIDEIKSFKPDVIHTHHSLEKLIVDIANDQFSVCHISTHHKTPEYKKTLSPLNGKWSLYDYVNRQPSIFLVSSIAFKNDLLRSNINQDNIYLVYPGIDSSLFKEISKTDQKIVNFKNRIGIKSEDLLILIPSVIRERKGIEFTLRSISKINIPGKKIKVIISGLSEIIGDNEKIALLSDILKPHEMVYTPEFSFEEMPLLYALSDMVAFGSQAEGLGLVVLEAMSCHRPVATTNVMGINEIIEDNKNGLLVEYGDEEKFANNIKEILINETLVERIVRNGELTLKNKFNLQKQAKEHLDIYKTEIHKVNNYIALVFLNPENKYITFLYAKEYYNSWTSEANKIARHLMAHETGNPNYYFGEGSENQKNIRYYGYKVDNEEFNLLSRVTDNVFKLHEDVRETLQRAISPHV